MTTRAQAASAALAVMVILAECIRELGEVPSGHLYANTMAYFTLDQYETVLAVLFRARLIARSGHVLTWIAPETVDVPAAIRGACA